MAIHQGGEMVEVDEVNVLVTGFGVGVTTILDYAEVTDSLQLFQDAPTVNASWLIAQSLPRELPPSIVHPSKTRITVYREPVEVNYATVQKLIPRLYEHSTHYDFVLHLGVSAQHPFYKIERYDSKASWGDCDVPDAYGDYPDVEYEPGYWDLCPERLETFARVIDVHRRWQDEANVCRVIFALGRHADISAAI